MTKHAHGPDGPTAYLVHGFVGAGKTTLARRIAAAGAAVLLSADDWYLELFGADGRAGAFDPEAERRLHTRLHQLWPELLRAGADVVLDMGLWTLAERTDCVRRAVAAGAKPVLIAVETDHETALQRLAVRTASDEAAFAIDPATYWRLHERFESVSDVEGVVKFRT